MTGKILQNIDCLIIDDKKIEMKERVLYEEKEVKLPLIVYYEITPIKQVIFKVHYFEYIDDDNQVRSKEGSYEIDYSKYQFERTLIIAEDDSYVSYFSIFLN